MNEVHYSLDPSVALAAYGKVLAWLKHLTLSWNDIIVCVLPLKNTCNVQTINTWR